MKLICYHDAKIPARTHNLVQFLSVDFIKRSRLFKTVLLGVPVLNTYTSI